MKSYKKYAYLFMVLYMVSYITRINYGAIISEMVKDTGFTKELLSMALTGSFITYGAGQVISGICGDRISPKKLIFCSFFVTSAMNILIPLCQNPWQMLAVWSVNGFAQAFMWPPLIKIMLTKFNDEEYSKASVIVSWGSSLGTILIYLVSPLLIQVSGWRSVFFIAAVCGIVMAFIWQKACPDVQSEAKLEAPDKQKKAKVFTPVLIVVMLAIVLQGMLRDGVTTWMPSYISETYNLGNSISILTGVIMPLFSVLCFQLAARLYMYKLKNPMTCAAVIFGAGTLSAALLYLITGKNAALSVLFSAMITGCMHGINLILICYIPAFYKKYGSISTISGVLNSCTYVGSAISTYGIAVLSENLGWSFTILSWIVIAALGTLACAVCIKPWKKQHM